MSTDDNDPVTIGIPSVSPSDDLAIISPLAKFPLRVDSVNTWTFTLFKIFVDMLSTKALAPDVAPTISNPCNDIRLSKSIAYTSMYFGSL